MKRRMVVFFQVLGAVFATFTMLLVLIYTMISSLEYLHDATGSIFYSMLVVYAVLAALIAFGSALAVGKEKTDETKAQDES